jgi:hypothetical protein
MDELKRIGASWARSFLAAALATYATVGWDPAAIANAGLAAVIPVAIRYLNKNDTAFGRR